MRRGNNSIHSHRKSVRRLLRDSNHRLYPHTIVCLQSVFSCSFQDAARRDTCSCRARGIWNLRASTGARRPSNDKSLSLFLREDHGAFATVFVTFLADRFAHVYFPHNVIYLCDLHRVDCRSLYDHRLQPDLVMQAMTADNAETRFLWEDDDPSEEKSPHLVSLSSRCAIACAQMGIVAGILTIGVTLFSTLFSFFHGLYGQAFIVLAFIAFRETLILMKNNTAFRASYRVTPSYGTHSL